MRYRAWQPPTCLHPTIPVHTPLVFDLVDTWMERSLGGCTYHVAHPGGRSYEQFPVNATKPRAAASPASPASATRRAKLRVAPAERSREFPYTLDLRTS